MNTNKTLGSNKQHSDRECLYKTIVTVTGKGARLQEWIPVFLTVNILALLMSGYLQKSSITMTERGLSQVVLNVIHNLVYRLQVYVQTTYLSQQSSIIRYTAFTGP